MDGIEVLCLVKRGKRSGKMLTLGGEEKNTFVQNVKFFPCVMCIVSWSGRKKSVVLFLNFASGNLVMSPTVSLEVNGLNY